MGRVSSKLLLEYAIRLSRISMRCLRNGPRLPPSEQPPILDHEGHVAGWGAVNVQNPITIELREDAPEWEDAHKRWITGKNPTDSAEWKRGVFLGD